MRGARVVFPIVGVAIMLSGCIPSMARSEFAFNERLYLHLTEPKVAEGLEATTRHTGDLPEGAQPESAALAATAATVVVPFLVEKGYDYAVKQLEKEQKKYYHSTSTTEVGEGFFEIFSHTTRVDTALPGETALVKETISSELTVLHNDRLVVHRVAGRTKEDAPESVLLFSAQIVASSRGTSFFLQPLYMLYTASGAKVPKKKLLSWEKIDNLLDRKVDVNLKFRMEAETISAEGKVAPQVITEAQIPFLGIRLPDDEAPLLWLDMEKKDEIIKLLNQDLGTYKWKPEKASVTRLEGKDTFVYAIGAAAPKEVKAAEIPKVSRWFAAPPLPVEIKQITTSMQSIQTVVTPVQPSTDQAHPTKTAPYSLAVTVEEANDLGDVLVKGVEYAKDNRDKVLDEIKAGVKKLADQR